ncbi:hypothetical protein JIN85_10150 [Luteolibacter pohnpeiensis]|uniref:TRASH domain-containing protein n=1 Tax=Luteolibacter pohnpeiensis TaxID=454153 RepID=A0A934S6I8_9BACT|nr:hypothetical protein [Luteolibacter pohnpeiensis]MBK1882778.1 hypothetical protein [Luteolibacter pohnpeiensis]
MKPTRILTFAAAALALAACQPKKTETTKTESAEAPAAPAEVATETETLPAGFNDVAPADAKPYPLTVCLVSGEEVGTMGTPPELVYKGQLIKFCCKHCLPDFKKDPEKFMAKLKEATKDSQS